MYTSICCNFCLCLQDSYLESRAETMQNIESTVVELGGIFQQLAHMVKEQEEMVERLASQRHLFGGYYVTLRPIIFYVT